MTDLRSGLAAGIGAYLLWGLFPLYWPLLEPAGPVEILAHRIAWSLLFIAAVLAATAGFRWVRTLDRRQVRLLVLAAVLITVNWGTFIYGVNSGRVVETSLGYFINPLVTVALAVIVLGERLRPEQRLAVAIAAIRVPLTTVGLLQYLAPTLQFLIGVVVYAEPMPATRLAGFALVWVALALFSVGALRSARAARLVVAPAPA